MRYSEPEIVRIAHVAFKEARKRSRKVCSVDKANVLETSQLWRDTLTRVGAEYPEPTGIIHPVRTVAVPLRPNECLPDIGFQTGLFLAALLQRTAAGS